MTYESNPHKRKGQIIDKFLILSNKYHQLSLLFYELSKSLKFYSKNKTYKEFKEYLKSLNLDLDKVEKLTKGLSELKLNDLKVIK